MSKEEKSCARCIHRKMCIARSSYDGVAQTWNEQYPFVKMNTNGDTLAISCDEYQTLTGIHRLPEKEKEKNDKKYHQSDTYKKIEEDTQKGAMPKDD